MGLAFQIGGIDLSDDLATRDEKAWQLNMMDASLDGRMPHWAYSGFHRFRSRLAGEVGIELGQMEGFAPRSEDWPYVSGKPWKDYADEALVPLLNHSDCDGDLTPEECEVVAPRLREVVARWPDDDWDRDSGERLADAMDECVRRSVPLVFT